MEGESATPLRPGQQEQLENCPPEVRPALQKLYRHVYFSHEARQERSRLRVAILKLRQRLDSGVVAEEAARLREELSLNEEWLRRTEKQCAEIDREVSQASIQYALRLQEWRLRGVPPERLEEARSILRQESLALDQARIANQNEMRESFLAMQAGVAAEAHLTVSRSLDETEKLQLRKTCDVALEGAAKLDAMLEEYKAQCDAIRDEHNRRIRALAD
ncbi:hypothetical protein EON82_11540 [bacterium]|nr:MAG: hypothetical protein EON82_11540 [bacterium]